MSKLFEVDDIGNRVTFNADTITHVSEVYRDSKQAKTVVHFATDDFYLQIAYEQFVQLWRKALDEDVRAAEQKQADGRRVIDALYGPSANRVVQRSAEADHMYNQHCSCAVCAQTRAVRGD